MSAMDLMVFLFFISLFFCDVFFVIVCMIYVVFRVAVDL
jgi:hypothetical protein